MVIGKKRSLTVFKGSAVGKDGFPGDHACSDPPKPAGFLRPGRTGPSAPKRNFFARPLVVEVCGCGK